MRAMNWFRAMLLPDLPDERVGEIMREIGEQMRRDRDRSGEAGETAKTGSTARQEPGPKASPTLKSTPTRTAK